MRDEIIKAAMADPENSYDPDDRVLYGPGENGERVALITFSPEMAERYAGPIPYWFSRRGFKLYDVIGNQYEPDEIAMIVTEEGLRPVDGAFTYRWGSVLADYQDDLDAFFEGLVKFTIR